MRETGKGQRGVALVTGAGSGIGRALAEGLGRRGYSLILAGRNPEHLESTRKKCGGRCVSADLQSPEGRSVLVREMEESCPDVVVLCAGYGILGDFADLTREDLEGMLQVNILAFSQQLRCAIDLMERRGSGRILAVSSTAGAFPGSPHFAVYYATKSYESALVSGIQGELRRKGVPVGLTLLCPGPVSSGFDARAGARHSLPGMTPEAVADAALPAFLAGKPLVVPGLLNRLAMVLPRLLPDRLLLLMADRQQRKKTGGQNRGRLQSRG